MDDINDRRFNSQNQKRIIGKYAALHDACCQYSPEISGGKTPLPGRNNAEKDYADNGFIENFCK